jgi:hypothetical protein
MSATDAVAPAISEPEPLTWDEICARHPDEWVCLAEVHFTHPHKLAFRTARLIGHGKTRSESRDQATSLFPQCKVVMNIYTTDLVITYFRPKFVIDDETRAALRYPR